MSFSLQGKKKGFLTKKSAKYKWNWLPDTTENRSWVPYTKKSLTILFRKESFLKLWVKAISPSIIYKYYISPHSSKIQTPPKIKNASLHSSIATIPTCDLAIPSHPFPPPSLIPTSLQFLPQKPYIINTTKPLQNCSCTNSLTMENAARGKWLAAAASIWIQCSCGASYAFGIYSPILKSTQNYDQSTLDTVSVFKDIGANAGIFSGLLYSAVVIRNMTSSSNSLLKSGPWVVHLAGAIQCFVGYFFMWLSVAGIIPRPNVWLMYLFMFLAAHAQTFFNTANVVTAVHNFPGYSGTIVGIMKVCVFFYFLLRVCFITYNSKVLSFFLFLIDEKYNRRLYLASI